MLKLLRRPAYAIPLTVVAVGIASQAFVLRASLTGGFADVPETHPNAVAITALRDGGIVTGYPDGTYLPERTLNRAEFTKIVVEAAFAPQSIDQCLEEYTLPVADVAADQWYAPAVCTAMRNGLVHGYGDGTFRPERTIAFAEAAKIVTLAFGENEQRDEVWYRPYVQSLERQRAIPITVDGFEAQLTRGEMAEIVYRLLGSVADRPSLTYDTLAHASAPERPPAISPEAQQFLSLMNTERVRYGLWPLEHNALLQQAADYHAAHMVSAGFYDHRSPLGDTAIDRIRATGYLNVDLAADCPYERCSRWDYRYGENILAANTAAEALTTWLNSPVHRANVLSQAFLEAGVSRWGPYWVVVFGGKIFQER